MKRWEEPYILASGSPRRATMLEDAGLEVNVCKPLIDDSVFQIGEMRPERWVQVLAIIKARDVEDSMQNKQGTIIAADTVCVIDELTYGQPKDRNDASAILQRMNNRSHKVCTGWCLMSLRDQRCYVGCEVVEVTIGLIDKEEIETYLKSDAWKGKAGAYNVSERIHAGWEIQCAGDITSVMGLPMKRLLAEIDKEL